MAHFFRGLTRRAFLLQKGGGAQKKADFFTAAAICGAHIGSMTVTLTHKSISHPLPHHHLRAAAARAAAVTAGTKSGDQGGGDVAFKCAHPPVHSHTLLQMGFAVEEVT